MSTSSQAQAQAAAAAAAARRAEQAREAEQRREAEARERQQAQQRQQAQERALAEQRAKQRQAKPNEKSALLGGSSVVNKSADRDFHTLIGKDQGNKNKLASDASALLAKHSLDRVTNKYEEQVVADASKAGVLTKTIDPAVNSPGSGLTGTAISATAAAVQDGLVKGPDVLKAAKQDGKNTVAQQAADAVTRQAVRNVGVAQSALDSKVSEKKDLDNRLATELAQVGPGLTGAQRKQYIASFEKDHKVHELDHQIDQAASTLDTTLQHNKPTLDESLQDGGANLATQPNGPDVGNKIGAKDVADTSLSALKDLATTNKAGDALKISGAMLNDPSLQTAMNQADHAGLKDTMNTVVEEAIPRIGTQMLVAGKGDSKQDQAGVIQQLKDQLEPFDKANQTLGGGMKLAKAVPALKDALKGNFSTLQALAKDWATENPNAIEKGFASLALASGATSFGDAASFKDLLKTVGSTSYGLDVAAKSASSLEWAAKIGGGAAKTAGKLAPGLGIVTSLAAAGSDLKEGGPGAPLSVTGDLMSAIGSGLESNPVTAPVGALTDAAGLVVSGVGYGINKLFGGEQSPNDEAAKILNKDMGFGKNMAGGLAHANVGIEQQMKQMGTSTGQIDDIAANFSGVSSDKSQFRDAMTLASKYNVSGQNLDQMLNVVGYNFSKSVRDPYNRDDTIAPGVGAGWNRFEMGAGGQFNDAMQQARVNGQNPNDPKVIAQYLNLGQMPGLPLWQGPT